MIGKLRNLHMMKSMYNWTVYWDMCLCTRCSSSITVECCM